MTLYFKSTCQSNALMESRETSFQMDWISVSNYLIDWTPVGCFILYVWPQLPIHWYKTWAILLCILRRRKNNLLSENVANLPQCHLPCISLSSCPPHMWSDDIRTCRKSMRIFQPPNLLSLVERRPGCVGSCIRTASPRSASIHCHLSITMSDWVSCFDGLNNDKTN